MTPTIEMKPLSQKKRQLVFIVSLVLFIVAVPFSVFYAIGYRFDFTDELTSIKSVGGMYVRSDAPNTEMFVDDMPVVDMRVFQKAAYIQNLEAGVHRVHVQGDAVQTWVKELPVYAHFVTEVASFNMPKIPQVRLITKWTDPITNSGVVFDTATSTEFGFASTTNTLTFSSTTATSTFVANAEYAYVESLFASSTEEKQALMRSVQATPVKAFTFDVPTSSAQVLTATTTKQWRDFTLFKKDGEVFISWDGDINDAPHYYCIMYLGEDTTTSAYGEHIYASLVASVASSTLLDTQEGKRVCREEIRMDRLGQEVLWFDFYPDSTDLVLMHLHDGLYVVEVDDRAWQNTQLLYPGTDIHVIQDGGRIYINDGEYYLEVFTEIASQV